MDACPLLIMSIVAVKPEDQGTFFQDFLGLSSYLCSVPEMLRTTMKPNDVRHRPRLRSVPEHSEWEGVLPEWGGVGQVWLERDSLAKNQNHRLYTDIIKSISEKPKTKIPFYIPSKFISCLTVSTQPSLTGLG